MTLVAQKKITTGSSIVVTLIYFNTIVLRLVMTSALLTHMAALYNVYFSIFYNVDFYTLEVSLLQACPFLSLLNNLLN